MPLELEDWVGHQIVVYDLNLSFVGGFGDICWNSLHVLIPAAEAVDVTFHFRAIVERKGALHLTQVIENAALKALALLFHAEKHPPREQATPHTGLVLVA